MLLKCKFVLKIFSTGCGPKMVEEEDGETTFSPTNSSKEHLDAEQIPQNNFWMLEEDMGHPVRQPIVFQGR